MERDSGGGPGRRTGLTEFEEFYQSAYARLVGQLFSVTGSLERAEDVVQEAFIRALDRWPRVQAYDVPELWVRRVAIDLAVSAGPPISEPRLWARAGPPPQATNSPRTPRFSSAATGNRCQNPP